MERQFGIPRFHQKAVIPEVSEGQELVKFHGQPALIPVAVAGEPMFGKSRFTLRQASALIALEQERIARAIARADELYSRVNFSDYEATS